jgi:hypothetical protein
MRIFAAFGGSERNPCIKRKLLGVAVKKETH